MNRLAFSFVLVALTGCASSQASAPRFFDVADASTANVAPSELDGETAAAFRAGLDTHESVRERLGLPMAKAKLRSDASCGERWVYSHPMVAAGDPKMRITLVDFDAAGVVCRSVYRTE